MNTFETNEYTIREIMFNYRIDISKDLLYREPARGMGRTWYHPLDWSWGFSNPLEAAKWVAEGALQSHFIT